MTSVSAKLSSRQIPVGHSRTRLCPWYYYYYYYYYRDYYIQVYTMPVWYIAVYDGISRYENLIPGYTGIYRDIRNRMVLSRWWGFQMYCRTFDRTSILYCRTFDRL